MNIARIVIAAAIPAIALVLLHGCGGGSGRTAAGSSAVSLYVTDDLGDYQSVNLTLNSVQLRHAGDGASCEIVTGPVSFDAAALGHQQLIDLVDTASCEARPYNRLRVELGENVVLTDSTGSTQTCKLVSYRDMQGMPNRLGCSNSQCAPDLTGAVNLIAGGHEHIALDADLKEFTVDNTRTPCEVTFKLSPLHAQGIDQKVAAGYHKAVSGVVSALDTTAKAFTLTGRHDSYRVQYAGVSDQLGIDTLLGRTASDGLRSRVRCESINPATTPPSCVAGIVRRGPHRQRSLRCSGLHAFDMTGVYAMSKAAVIHMTRAMALEWARFGINVNALCPGYIDTEMNHAHWQTDAGRQLLQMLPRKRLGRPEDLDSTLVMLCASQSHFVNGAVIAVDDGTSL